MTPRFRLLAGLALAALISCAAFSAEPPAPVQTPPSRTDLHRLASKELLAQATALHEKASLAYLAQLRELVTLERSLDRARKRIEDVKVPPPRPTAPTTSIPPCRPPRNPPSNPAPVAMS